MIPAIAKRRVTIPHFADQGLDRIRQARTIFLLGSNDMNTGGGEKTRRAGSARGLVRGVGVRPCPSQVADVANCDYHGIFRQDDLIGRIHGQVGTRIVNVLEREKKKVVARAQGQLADRLADLRNRRELLLFRYAKYFRGTTLGRDPTECVQNRTSPTPGRPATPRRARTRAFPSSGRSPYRQG